MSIAASAADARLGYPAVCGCAVWVAGCVPADLMMLGGKSRKPQKQG